MICGHEPAARSSPRPGACVASSEGDRVILYTSRLRTLPTIAGPAIRSAARARLRAAYGWSETAARRVLPRRGSGLHPHARLDELHRRRLRSPAASGPATRPSAASAFRATTSPSWSARPHGPRISHACPCRARPRSSASMSPTTASPSPRSSASRSRDQVRREPPCPHSRGDRGSWLRSRHRLLGQYHGRQLAVRAARQWGRIAFVGEGGTV